MIFNPVKAGPPGAIWHCCNEEVQMAAVFRRLLLAAILLLTAPTAFSNDKALVLGVFPYLTPGKLMQQHAPLRSYIEATMGRPVEIVTAPNFDEFVARTRKGDYDIVLTAPHLGRLAQVRDGYIPLVHTQHELQAVFLARKDSGIRTVSDLRGKRLMVTEQTSLFYQVAEEKLRQDGLVPGQDITLVLTATHNNALYAPVRGEADASVTGSVLWQRAEPEIRAQLVEIGSTKPIQGFIVLASSRLPVDQSTRLRSALLGFADTAEGKGYFASTGLKGFGAVTPNILKSMDPYIDVFLDRK
jgi:phosphonate transport system substrate-binding protein